MADHKQQHNHSQPGTTSGAQPGANVAPSGIFTVEFGDAFGRSPSLGTLRKRYRPYWSLALMASRKDDQGKRVGSRDFGEGLSQMPDVPGIHMEIDLGRSCAREYDPLAENKELHAEADAAMGLALKKSAHKTLAWPEVKYSKPTMSEHVFKTLAREVAQLVEQGMARVVSGKLPEVSEIDRLPGRYLHDPWNSNANRPRFEDQVDVYLDKLEAAATT